MNQHYYHPVPVGHNVYVSHRDACNIFYWEFPKILHIWRMDYPNNSCNHVMNQLPNGMSLEYHDGESLEKADKPLSDIALYLGGEEKILIHCAAGQTRSPTLAVFAKLLRGATISEAVGEVMQNNWTYRGIVSNLCLTPMEEIFKYMDSRNGK